LLRLGHSFAKITQTMANFMDHLADDVLPELINKLSSDRA
jgi:hypothetical protein